MNNKNIQKQKSIWPLIILTLLFIIPFSLAWYYYHTRENHIFKQVNHGELIQPAKNAQDLVFQDVVTQNTFTGKELRGHWVLWYVSPNKCAQECHDNLYNIKQLITALGKNSPRVHSLFLNLPECLIQPCETTVLEHYPDLKQAQMSHETFNQFFLGISDTVDRERVGEIYLSDPRGFVIMRYSGETNPKDILKDLKRLLKVSQIG